MTETESMVVRVAKAMCGVLGSIAYDDLPDTASYMYRKTHGDRPILDKQEAHDVARAAIEAMRDCDNDMLEAMHTAMFEDKFTGGELPMLNAGWVAALDKALEE